MRSIFKFLLAIIFLITTKTISAQGVTENPMKPFTDLAGNWESTDAVLDFAGTIFNVNYFADFEKTSDGSGVIMYEKCNIPGIGKLNGANLIGFDPFDGQYHWFSVDNFGTTHDHMGSFTDETHFYMEHKSIRDGKEFLEKIWFDFIDTNTLKLKLIASTDGVVEQTVTATFKRKGRGNQQQNL